MIGGLPLGMLLACCIVVLLFVPMVMAGYHLSRYKMLFFSGAIFIISLAVCVHLTPYFPSVNDFVTSVQSVVIFDNREDSCVNLVNEVAWDVKQHGNNVRRGQGSPVVYDKKWDWSKTWKVMACEFQKLGKGDISELLNGTWVVVAGDSQSRLVAETLLGLVLESDRMESIKADLFKRHSDYGIVVEEMGMNMKLDFVWAPYADNLTNMMMGFKQNGSYPDVMVMGAGLWHMLHVTNESDYSVSLKLLRRTVVSLLPFLPELGTDGPVMGTDVSLKSSPHLFWLGMPMLVNGMLNTEEKRERMTDEMWHAYDKVLRDSRLLRRYGGPFLLLDIQSLSWNCGPRCTVDGMHYDGAVYEAVVQILLNALLIESHPKFGAE
ncbi:Protein ALTERED XYLOGLUCAN 9 [Linum grandiflorum]